MVFSGIPFLFYFLPAFLLIYFVSPAKAKNFVLLVFSLMFYAWGEPVYISLLLLSSVVDYINGRCLEHFEGQIKKQRLFLVISMCVNLGLLGIFKYLSLFITTINDMTHAGIRDPKLMLPLGISFFTFQTMSYSIDVYRKDIKAEHNFINYMTYVCMFPQLVAGPIVRYQDIGHELENRRVTPDGFTDGAVRFLMGIFKKVLIANQVGSLWDTVLAANDRSFMLAWLGLAAFTLQIYFDFSGYSDMAIGMGGMMGFTYPENFNYPYISRSITDFWRRWHMTLSGWFRDYVYIPLGGNRKGVKRQIINIAIVWALTGFWHGASWNYLLWGLFYGAILIIEKLFAGKLLNKLSPVVSHIYTIFIVMLGWMIFAIEDINKLKSYAADVFYFGAQGFADKRFLYELRNYLVVLVIGIIISTPVYKKIKESEKTPFVEGVMSVTGLIAGCVLVVVCVAMLVADSYNPFLYFRF